MKRRIIIGSIIFIVILIIILMGCYLWKNRFKYMDGESLNYEVKSDEISKIRFEVLGGENYNYYVFDEQIKIDNFINELNNLELIPISTEYDLNISAYEDREIVFSIYKIDGYHKHNTIAVYDKYILVFHEWYDVVTAKYVIKDTYYQEKPINVFDKFINDEYLDVEATNIVKAHREELRKSTNSN